MIRNGKTFWWFLVSTKTERHNFRVAWMDIDLSTQLLKMLDDNRSVVTFSIDVEKYMFVVSAPIEVEGGNIYRHSFW